VRRRLPFHLEADLPGAVTACTAVFADHGVVAIPTETFYGLAVPPDDEQALARLFALKGRPHDKAAPVVVASMQQAASLVQVPEAWVDRLAETWPAPLTVVLPAHRGGTLAVRVPAHPLLRALLEHLGPLTATSANLAGGPPAITPAEVEKTFGEGLALILDGGPTPGGLPSTLVDLTVSPPRLLRPGAWPVHPAWGVKVV